MSETPTFRKLFESARKALPYVVEGAIISFTEQVVARMRILGIKRTDLASNLGATPAYVTKLLRGGTNFTLESMIKVSESLDSELKIELVPKVSDQDWIELIDKTYPAQRPETIAWRRNQIDHSEAKGGFLGPFHIDQPDCDEQFTFTT
jgi:transcriptional regulator with XRE-family HTH domain